MNLIFFKVLRLIIRLLFLTVLTVERLYNIVSDHDNSSSKLLVLNKK